MLKVKPLGNRVIIDPVQLESKTASGIIIPDTAKGKPQKGKVIAVGPGSADEKMEVDVNDLVLYGKNAGIDVKLDGKDYLIMDQRQILAII